MNQSTHNNYDQAFQDLVRMDAQYQAAVEIEKQKILKEHEKTRKIKHHQEYWWFFIK